MTMHLLIRTFFLYVTFAFLSAQASSSEETNYLLMLSDESSLKRYVQEHDIFDEHYADLTDAFFDMNAHARVINNWLFSIDAFKVDFLVNDVANKRLWMDSDELGCSVEISKAVGRVLWCPSIKFSTCADREMQLLLSLAKQLLEN